MNVTGMSCYSTAGILQLLLYSCYPTAATLQAVCSVTAVGWVTRTEGKVITTLNVTSLLHFCAIVLFLTIFKTPLTRKQDTNTQKVLKPIRTNGIALWGCASKSNISVTQRYQSKLLRTVTNASRYVTNQTLHSNLHIPYVHSVLQDYIHKHRSALESHPNPLVETLIHTTQTRRMKRRWTFDVINRGAVNGLTPGPTTQPTAH